MNTLGITGKYTIEEIAHMLEDALSIQFEEPNSFDYGYPVYRALMGSQDSPDWIWITENEVPRGFVRPSDPRYLELVALLPGTDLRIPDHPEVKLILSFTERIASQVKAACSQLGIVTVSPG